MENHNFSWVNQLEMAICNSFLYVYQRVYPINIPLNHHKIPLNHYKIPLNHYQFMFGNHSSQPSDTLNPRRKIYSSQMAEKGGQWNVASRLKRPWLGMKFRPNDAKFQWLLKNRENEVLTTTKNHG